MVLIPAATLQNKLQNSVKVLLRAQGTVFYLTKLYAVFQYVCYDRHRGGQIDKSQKRRRQGCRCGEKNVSYQATKEQSHK